jgi:hypothetical protein
MGPIGFAPATGRAGRGGERMTCDELRGNLELYALGLLEEPELSEVRDHLLRQCLNCVPEFAAAQRLNNAILTSVEDVAPSPALRRRILASVGREKQRALPGWLGWVGAVAGTAAAVMLFLQLQDTNRALDASYSVERQARARLVQTRAEFDNMLAMLAEPATRQVTFGKGPQGKVLANPTRGLLLVASNLPATPPGRTYAFWVIPKGGQPRPAGLFQSDENGNAHHQVSGPVDLSTTGAFAVSVEPEGGSPAPTTTPLIVVPLAE